MNSFQLISTCWNLHNDNATGLYSDILDSGLSQNQTVEEKECKTAKKAMTFSHVQFSYISVVYTIFSIELFVRFGLVLSRVHVCAMSFCVILSLWKDFFLLSPLSILFEFYFICWQKKRHSLRIFYFSMNIRFGCGSLNNLLKCSVFPLFIHFFAIPFLKVGSKSEKESQIHFVCSLQMRRIIRGVLSISAFQMGTEMHPLRWFI